MKKNILYNKAQLILTDLYENKDLSDIDKHSLYNEYIRLLEIESTKNNADAIYELAQTYEDINFWGINKDYDPNKCFYLYTQACQLNHPGACNNLGSMYIDGLSCKKDVLKGINLYEKAGQLDLLNTAYQYNYRYSLRCFNSSVLGKIIFQYLNDSEVGLLIQTKAELILKFRFDNQGYFIKTVEIKKSDGFSKKTLDSIIHSLETEKIQFLYNRIFGRKVITVSFLKYLMMYYREAYQEGRANSQLEYLKYRIDYWSK